MDNVHIATPVGTRFRSFSGINPGRESWRGGEGDRNGKLFHYLSSNRPCCQETPSTHCLCGLLGGVRLLLLCQSASPLPRVVFCVQSPQDLLLVISKAAIVSGQFSLGQDPELAIDSIRSTEISGNSVGGSSQQAIHKCFVM